MYIFAYLLLVASFLCAIFASGIAGFQLMNRQTGFVKGVERAVMAITALMTVSSFILVYALINFDFSLDYVARYTDKQLEPFYRITAFWAGQEGSLLFWGWSVVIFGAFFLFSKAYAKLKDETKLWFWMFFLGVIGFFLLLITGWSNPFITLNPVPFDGNGLNPLLQNPGMIFHPPLLFLGYGGFVIPGCLALAQTLSRKRGEEGLWSDVCRPFTILAWILLSAGIVLGAWWAYMELGWGGYWAWDPVENASLIPWLISTAFLHTSVVESRRDKMHRFNVFIITLTTISAFFATFIVRSGIIQSVHGYPDGGVGTPLLIFMLLFLIVAIVVSLGGQFKSAPIEGPETREGMLCIVSGILLALCVIILLATMWPVISKWFGVDSVVLGAKFYNWICLPLFMLITMLLAVCPWVGWKGGFRHRLSVFIVLGLMLAAVPAFMFLMQSLYGAFMPPDEAVHPIFKSLAAISAACAVAVTASLLLLFAKSPAMLKAKSILAAHGVHLGVAVMVFGVAFSGPFQVEDTFVLKSGDTARIGSYEVTLKNLYEGQAPAFRFYEAELALSKNGKEIGIMSPQRRNYSKYPGQYFAEAATIFSVGDELYSSLLAVDDSTARAQLHISINPMVNMIWIGGVILCLFPFLSMLSKREREN